MHFIVYKDWIIQILLALFSLIKLCGQQVLFKKKNLCLLNLFVSPLKRRAGTGWLKAKYTKHMNDCKKIRDSGKHERLRVPPVTATQTVRCKPYCLNLSTSPSFFSFCLLNNVSFPGWSTNSWHCDNRKPCSSTQPRLSLAVCLLICPFFLFFQSHVYTKTLKVG